MRTRAIATITAVLLAGTLTACSSSDDKDPKAGPPPVSSKATEPPGTVPVPAPVPVGQAALVAGGLEVTTTVEPIAVFTGARGSTPDGQVNAASLTGGGLPVHVRIAVANKGPAPFDVSKILVRDFVGTNSGGKATYTAWTNLPEEKLTGLVAPGSTARGEVNYVVPPNVAGGFRITIGMQPGFAGPLADVVVTGKLEAPAT